MQTGRVFILLVCVLSVCLATSHDPPNPVTFSAGAVTTNTIFPCNRQYYVTTGFASSPIGTYARIDFNWTNWLFADDPQIFVGANFIPFERQWTDYCQLGNPATACTFWDICRVIGTTAYVTVQGGHVDALTYQFTMASQTVSIQDLGAVGNSFRVQKRVRGTDLSVNFNPPLFYDHYSLNVPTYQQGMFLVANLSFVESNTTGQWPQLWVNYAQLATQETGCYQQICKNSNGGAGQTCNCLTDDSHDNCNVTVLPCFFKAGTYYFSVKLPAVVQVNYTIGATVFAPTILTLQENAVYQYTTDVIQSAHHVLHVNQSRFTAGTNYRLRVTVNNVVGGGAWVYVQQNELAGGKDGCHPSVASCVTSWSCNVYVPYCRFGAGDWYIGVDTYTDKSYRLPVTYSIQAAIEAEPSVTSLQAGDKLVTQIVENDYHFYSIDIPANLDETWLYFELYLNRNTSEVWVAMHPGSLVGPYNYCYPYPPADNWTCSTGGDPQNREACYFHMPTCYLPPGTIYFTVWAKNYTKYGHDLTAQNTFYGLPAEYTLKINLEEPKRVLMNVSYSEHVYPNHYSHYYLPIDGVVPGEHLTVHFADVKRGTITGYIYPDDLAGECPCFKNILNCTTSQWCDLQVDPCLFRNAVWYVSARGNSLADNAAVPIGFTLTVIRNPAPPIWNLTLGEINTWDIGWNESHHFRLPVPNSAYTDNLIIKIILDQDAGNAYELHNLVAYNKFPSWYEDYFTHHCYEQYCFANTASNSYCTIRIPSCDWNALSRGMDWYISVYTAGWPGFNSPRARYTVRTFLESDPVTQLISGNPVVDSVQNLAYRHYYLDLTNGTGTNNMMVEIYTNNDQDQVSFRMNIGNYAGTVYSTNPSWNACFNYLVPYECNTTTSCLWQFDNCMLQPAIYYFSVYGTSRAYEDTRYKQQYYDVPVEYTLTVSLYQMVTTLQFDIPVAGYLVNHGLNHYTVTIPPLNPYQYFVLETANSRHGTTQTYVRMPETGAKLAGPCPCYEWDWRYATSDASDGTATPASKVGSLILPYCWLHGKEGIYTIAVEDLTPDTDPTRMFSTMDLTPTAYTLTAKLVTPIVSTNYTIGSKVTNQKLGNNLYWHYQLNVNQVTMPQQLQVYFTNVKFGSLEVFLNPVNGAAENTANDCFAWKQTCGGGTCSFAVPDCIWNAQGVWWLSVLAHGPLSIQYDLETRLKAPVVINLLTTNNYTNLYGFTDHYKLPALQANAGSYLVVDLQNANAPVNVYINYNNIAGPSGCGSCVHAITVMDGPTLCPGTCKYRVPSCFFKTGDWFIAIAPTAVRSNYTIKVSLLDSAAATTAITQFFTTTTFSLTKIEDWVMYTIAVPASATPTRLLITGSFGAGAATTRMYVNHTSMVGGTVCGDWMCDSTQGASCTFVSESCCTQFTTYRVGFHQIEGGNRDGSIFVQNWPEHGTNTLTLNGGPIVSTADAEGVGETNYRFLKLNIPNSVITSQQIVYLNVSIQATTSSGSLSVFIRPNYPAGNTGRCYSKLAAGTASFSTPLIWEIPSCLLSNNDWYIGLFNPAGYPANPAASKPVWYTAEARTYNINPVTMGAANWFNNTVDPNFPVSWVHFSFTVAPTDIVYNKNTLRVESVANFGTVSNLYLNFGGLAGAFTLGTRSCGGACYSSASPTLQINVPSCTLKSGIWYASIRVAANVQYAFRAQMITQNYVDIGAPTLQTGPAGDPPVYAYPVMSQILTDPTNKGVDVAYYRFTLTSDRIGVTTKLSVNVTNVANGRVDVTIYKDCILQWQVSATSSAVISDSEMMGPCDLIAGEYQVVIAANNQIINPSWYANYTVQIFLRDANNYALPLTGFAGLDHSGVYSHFHDVWTIAVPQLTSPWANNSLAVQFNVSCGALTAYLNYGTPGGPGCYIATCSSTMTQGTVPAKRFDSSCTMFLDTCQVQPGNYYLTVVGDGQEFSSQYVYQKVMYEVWATPVYYNFTSISPDLWTGYNITALPQNLGTKDWYRYWYLDEETSNPGSRLKFTLNGTVGSVLWVGYENAFASQSALSNPKCNPQNACTIAAGTTTCTFTYDSCAVKIGRYYIMVKVNTPVTDWQFTQVRVWRQEVDIPYLWPDTPVTGTVGDDYPQFYKILVINPSDTEFYGDFRVYNVMLGTVTATLSHVEYTHQTPGQQASCLANASFKKQCTASATANCSVYIQPCYPKGNLTFFWQIDATTHDKTNLSVQYSLVFHLHPPVTPLPLWTRICDQVMINEYRFWRLSPQVSAVDQILYINLTTLYNPEKVTLSLSSHVNRLPTEDTGCFDNYWYGNNFDVVGNTGLIQHYECAFTDFHVAVRGNTALDPTMPIKYLIEATSVPAPFTNLTLGTPAYFCAGNRYYYKVTVPAGTTFFEVLLNIEDASATATVWVKYGSIAAPNCWDKTATGKVFQSTWWVQPCGLPAGVYYVTVSSPSSAFTITAKTTSKQIIPVGNATAATGAALMGTPDVDATIPIYSINVTTSQLLGYTTPQLDFWITSDDAAGSIAISKIYYSDGVTVGTAASTCDVNYVPSNVGFNTVRYTVRNCYLQAGTYYAFVSAVPTACNINGYVMPNATVSYSITAAVTQTFPATAVPLNTMMNGTVLSNGGNHYFVNGSRIVGNFLYVQLMNVDINNPLAVWYSPRRPVDPSATTPNAFGTKCVYTGATSTTNDWASRYYAQAALIGSGVFRIDTCMYAPADFIYFFIAPANPASNCTLQPYSIKFNWMISDITWTPLTSNTVYNAALGENRETKFYSLTSTGTQAVTLRITPITADVQVSISMQDNQCDGATFVEYSWTKTCVPGQYCDIEIPTRAAHPEKGRSVFYVMVTGNRANYTAIWWNAQQNCGTPQFAAGSFCGTDLINYPTWNWNNWQLLDDQARGIFEKLYYDFHYSRDFPCYVNCNTSLRMYACYESFRMCDSDGFITPVCRPVCDNVVYYCHNWFDTVQDRGMNCTSHQYGDPFYSNCTGLGTKVPYPPNTFVNIQGAVAGSSIIAPSLVLVLLALFALMFRL